MEEAEAIPQFESERVRLLKLNQEEQVSELLRGSLSLRQEVGMIGRLLERVLERLDALAPQDETGQSKNVPATPRRSLEEDRSPRGTPDSSNPRESSKAPKESKAAKKDDGSDLEGTSAAEQLVRQGRNIVMTDEQFFQLTARLDRRGSRRDLEDLVPRRTAPKDDSDQESDDEDAARERRQDRRTSMLYQPSLAKGVTATQVSMYRSQPDYDHIVLKYLSVNAVFKFWEAVDLYQMKHGIEINAATQIEDDVRRTIMAKSDMTNIRDFLALKPDKLRRIIQSAMKPTDRSMFATRLEQSLYFWKKDEQPFDVTIETWQRFWDRLLLYKSEFETKYEFLAHENSRNEPKLDNKDGGTIKIFLSKLPREYAENAFRNLSTSRFSSLKDFLDAFYDQAQLHYKMSVRARELASFTKPTSRRAQDDSNAKREQSKAKGAQRLNALEDREYLEEPLMENPSESPRDDQEAEETLTGTGDSAKAPTSELNAFGGLNRGVPLRVPPKPPGFAKAPDKAASAPKGPNGCFRALTEGKCTKPNCTFDHSTSVLQATKDDLMVKLGKDLWKARAVQAIYAPEQSFSSPEEDG